MHDVRSSSWRALNRTLDAATEDLRAGCFIAIGGEGFVRWMPPVRDSWFADGATAEPSRFVCGIRPRYPLPDAPAAVLAIADRHQLSRAIEKANRAAARTAV